jgi:SAM-dependent methyltransferase
MSALAPKLDLLDPRKDASPPIQDAVHIPFDEIASRTYELPPRNAIVRVAGEGHDADSAIETLAEIGRQAEPVAYEFTRQAAWGRLWEPNEFLVETLPNLKAARAMDIACGCGREAVAMAGEGWQVTAVDHLEDALAMGRGLERKYLREASPIRWQCADVEEAAFQPSGRFGLITMFYFLHRPLIQQAEAWLEPGGNLLVETFTAEHRRRMGKPRRETLVLQEGELLELAQGLQVRHYDEGDRGSRHTARLWACRT